MTDIYIDDTAEVSPEAEIGGGTQIWRNCQVRAGASLGQDCVLSKDVYVGKNVTIDDGSKLQNGVSAYEGLSLGRKVFCGPHMTFTNDLNIRIAPEEYSPIPTTVEDWVSIGAHSTILPDLTIREYALIGAHTLVTKDVPAHALEYGVPSEIQGVVCYCGEKIASVGDELNQHTFECDECGETVEVNTDAFNRRLSS